MLKYRPEIDGLRAIAVIPVLLYHAGFPYVKGGFSGVDVFFVISGYLITSILWAEVQAKRLSLMDFYERRARRILPALFLVLSACALTAWWYLPPTHLKDFSNSLLAIGLFGSNIYFWRSSGYFDSSADLKPLLHTWSLSLEEQFYLFFPIFLFFFARRGAAKILACIAVISFAAACYFVSRKPEAAFYLLPTRAWELIAGGCAGIASYRLGGPIGRGRVAGLLAMSGLVLVLLGYSLIDVNVAYPGFWTLLPVLGAVLVVMFASAANYAGSILSSRVLVFVGLMSYSLYLWHQPILAYARLLSPDALTLSQATILLVICFALSYVTWRFVESPFRDRRKIGRASVFVFASAGILISVLAGLLLPSVGFAERRLTAKQLQVLAYYENNPQSWSYFIREQIPEKYRYRCDFYDIASSRAGKATRVPVPEIARDCFARSSESGPVLFLWGDSHAQHHYYGLRRNLPDAWQVLQVTSSGCAPSIELEGDSLDYCRHSNWFALKTVRESRPDIVVIGQNSPYRLDKIRVLADEVLKAGAKKIVVVGPVPHWTTDLPIMVAYHLFPSIPQRSNAGIDRKVLSQDAELKRLLEGDPRLSYVSVIDHFCNLDGCRVYVGADPIRGLTSWDYGHLTPVASDLFSREVLAPYISSQAF